MARFGDLDTQYFDDSGDPLVNGKVYFYETGTTTPKTTYADVDFTIPNTNPVILTAAGRQPNIFFDGVAKAILATSAGTQILVRDPIGDTANSFGNPWIASKRYSANDVVQGSDGEYYVSLSNGNVNNNPVNTTGLWTFLYSVEWNAGTTYKEGSVVTYESIVYQSLQNTNLNQNPSTVAAYWTPIQLSWISTQTYALNVNVVGSDGVLYTSIQAANTGNEPSASPLWWVGTSAAAAASAIAAAASAAAALVSENAAAASETAAGLSETAAAASAAAAAADAIATAADAVSTADDAAQTALDRIATAADVVDTNADVVLTHADVVTTNAAVASVLGAFSSPDPIGNVTPNTGAFTTLSASVAVTLSGGTANGVAYLNGSKVVTSGSGLQFDGANLGIGMTPVKELDVAGEIRASTGILFGTDTAAANALDDYEEGTWTPVFTCTTPGDLSVGYNFQQGKYTKIGNLVTVKCFLFLTTFSHSTASGDLIISGLPFTASADVNDAHGAVTTRGFTKATYTNFAAAVFRGTSNVNIATSGSGVASATMQLTDYPTGVSPSPTMTFTVTYTV